MDNPVPTKSGGVEGASGIAGGDATAALLNVTCVLEGVANEDVNHDVKIARYKDILNSAHQEDGAAIRPRLRMLLDKNVGILCDLVQLIEDAQRTGVDQNNIRQMKDSVKSNMSMCYMLLEQISTPRI